MKSCFYCFMEVVDDDLGWKKKSIMVSFTSIYLAWNLDWLEFSLVWTWLDLMLLLILGWDGIFCLFIFRGAFAEIRAKYLLDFYFSFFQVTSATFSDTLMFNQLLLMCSISCTLSVLGLIMSSFPTKFHSVEYLSFYFPYLKIGDILLMIPQLAIWELCLWSLPKDNFVLALVSLSVQFNFSRNYFHQSYYSSIGHLRLETLLTSLTRKCGQKVVLAWRTLSL